MMHKQQTKFKLGDKVIVVGPGETDTILGVTWAAVERPYLGDLTTITAVSTDHYESRYKIEGHNSWLAESWLTPLTPACNLHTPGAKDDVDKLPVALVYESFPNALLEVAKVADYGAKKYTRGGWKEVHDASFRYADALARHELAQYSEGDHDAESGLLHLTHMAWNALALLELKLHKKQV